ncbi:MAG TPA: adenine phosphoribosyltransferase [Desulfurobacteriaceae bacterium]|nr:adenine phosphoribosyltransferase [Desulfurobacteriaceae bacterium]
MEFKTDLNLQEDIKQIYNLIRDIPDFPKPGIIFKDITPILKTPWAFQKVIDYLANRYVGKKIDLVVGIESRGFILGSALAYKLGAGFVPVRKKGKLPYKTISVTYELEYGTDSIEMHIDAIKKSDKVILVDDVLATGGTMNAAISLVEKLGGEIMGIDFLLELTFLGGRKKLEDRGYSVFSLIKI